MIEPMFHIFKGPISVLGTATYSDATDVKSLIPDAGARRRMSRLIKMGVSVGMEALQQAGIDRPDAIITATGLGFLSDSEKILAQMIGPAEEGVPNSQERSDNSNAVPLGGLSAMSPTPFMQSTFNTIGSHLAIMTGCTGYNMTYSHRWYSMSNALLDATLLLTNREVETVLLVAADELTPTLENVELRMGMGRNGMPEPGEGATALLLSLPDKAQALGKEIGQIADIFFIEGARKLHPEMSWCTQAAQVLAKSVTRRLPNIVETTGFSCIAQSSLE